jgi:outer membrane protein TolC
VENAICRLLAQTPQHIKRSAWGSSLHHPEAKGDTGQRMFDTQFLLTGVPAMLLKNRPDIRLADYAMEEAFYNTQVARSAFFPSITLSGTAGWTNSAGAVVNPGKILLNAVASLTQPIYAQGKLKANLKINQLNQEDLINQYVQTVIEAGSEVNEALADCQAALEKHGFYERQVEVLKLAYRGTHELMDNGKASYLEVLTAQERLLNAQLNQAVNMYNGAQGLIALYIALGGATR